MAAAFAPDGGQPVSRWLKSQGLKLHYLDWGNDGAPVLVLMHGARDHCHSWDRIAPRLSRSWHVIAPDLRGHGDSDHVATGVYAMEGYLYDLAQLVSAQSGPVSILAHSLGGRIALRYAGIFPEWVRRLVAIEGLGPPPSQLETMQAEPAAARMRGWIESYRSQASQPPRTYPSTEAAAARMAEQNPGLPPDFVRHLTLCGTRREEDGSYSWKFDPRVRLQAPIDMTPAELESVWPNIACPVLLVHGEASFLPDPRIEHRDRQFGNARIAIVAGAGHWVHHDRMEETLELAAAFLSDASGTGTA